MGVQTKSKRSEDDTKEKLGAFIIKCIMMLHTESKKTGAQLGAVVHSLYKEVYHRELNDELMTSFVQEKPERETGSRGRKTQTESKALSLGVTRGV